METKDEVEKKEDVSLKKVDTAVKFLQNPRVKETPFGQRKAFLAKKGLSEDEIVQAFKHAGISEQASENGVSPQSIYSDTHGIPNRPEAFSAVNSVPHSVRWRDFLVAAVITGGFGYAVVRLVKTYVLPYFLGQKEEIVQIQSSVSELKENLNERVDGIQETLDSVQKLLQEQQQMVQNLSLSLSSSQSCLTKSLTDSHGLSEVKSELSSLKGLLLNRRQFPVVQSTSGIPLWQRSESSLSAAPPANTGSQNNSVHKNAESEDIRDDTATISQHSTDSSSTTLETHGTQDHLSDTESEHEYDPEGSEASSSTLSSDVGSPNLSLTGMKESLSETYVKVPPK